MCSSETRPSLGLNFGNHFNGWVGNGCNCPTIWTNWGFVHGLWSIMGIRVEEYVLVVEGDWVEDDCAPVPM